MTTISALEAHGVRSSGSFKAFRCEFKAASPGARIHSEAEETDFLWDARVKERYLGQHLPADLGDDE